MNTSSNHISFNEFVANEVKTLEFIITRGCLKKSFKDLNQAIEYAYLDFESDLKKGRLVHFDFHAEFEMKVENKNRSILLGANVKSDFQECSYFLAMTSADDKKQLIRKFHFDYARKDIFTAQDVPLFHLQYGGKMSPRMITDGFVDEKLDNWLSLPRLNFSPINLALLLDIMLCEFQTLESVKVAQSDLWRDLIFKNEKLLSKNYFKNICDHLQSPAYKKTYLLRDFCYGR